jgi:tRNA modification GTPase
MPEFETIVAPATASGESALAIVRLSGPRCGDIRISALKSRESSLKPRQAVLARYHNIKGTVVDHLVAIYYPAGNSFTGESMLELMCHGNPLICQLIIEDCIERGCRLAEPGEFSRLAFTNGKMDLSQAEAVADLIHARSEKAITAARKQLEGSVGEKVKMLLSSILHTTAHLEAYIDFPEEDLPPEDQQGPKHDLKELIDELNQLCATQHYRSLLNEGIRMVILGLPNAGKSSLLNALTGENRVIVSETPGTTRDYISERMMIGPYLVNFVDTAGIHETDSEIEQAGIARSLEQARKADICLWVVDASAPSPALPAALDQVFEATTTLVVENKSDLPRHSEMDEFLETLPHFQVSALKGSGLQDLRGELLKQIESGVLIPDEDMVLVSARHAEALETAKSHIQSSLDLLQRDEPAELAAQELHLAIEAMGRIIGKIDNESMLDELFQSFCIGK